MQRQIKSCTHCRQHKVRCDASKYYPKPCSRCSKFHLACVVDQNFKPRKGGQVELLREHLAKIQEQIQTISKGAAGPLKAEVEDLEEAISQNSERCPFDQRSKRESDRSGEPYESYKSRRINTNGSIPPTAIDSYESSDPSSLRQLKAIEEDMARPKHDDDLETGVKEIEASVAERMAAGGRLVPVAGPYCLEDITLQEQKADALHNYFMENCSPYIPIFESNSAGELYARSEFLFWAVMTTAAIGESTSDLYLSLVGPIRRLAAEKSLMATTRSSSVVQALLVLSSWPLPSEKMLEDMSPRYASLAYSMGLQLGIHRGKFIYEFSRNQQLMPNAVKWRSRTWVQTYITQQMVSAASGIPPSMPVDYIIDHALHDKVHPLSPRIAAFLKISVFYSKLVSIMGSNISTQDGLMDPESRSPTLDLLKTDLSTMFPPADNYEDPVVEIMLSYARCIVDNFAFLPETPLSYQSGFLIDAFQASTRIVTLVRKLVGNRKVMEFPSFIRNPCNYAVLTLFRLQSMPQIPDQLVSSARESVVTVHHLYRNIAPSWLDSRVSNDISRVAKILESLNHVMMVHPELLRSRRVMRRMRSHLTFSLFYELIYIIHEARRRNAQKKSHEETEEAEGASDSHEGTESLKLQIDSQNPHNNREKTKESNDSSPESWVTDDSPANTGAMHQFINSQSLQKTRELNPLPLFNNIDTGTYISSTVVSPNGTTMTKLMHANENPVQVTQVSEDQCAKEIRGSGLPQILSVFSAQRPLENHGSQIGKTPQNLRDSNGFVNTTNHDNSRSYSLFDGNHSPAEGSLNHVGATFYTEGNDAHSGLLQLFDGLDWMDTEGDDFLGWMLPRND